MNYDVDLPQKSAGELFAETITLLTAAQNSAIRPGQTATTSNLITKARSTLEDALAQLGEERDVERAEHEQYITTAKTWLVRLRAAESELATLRHVHQPVEVVG